MSYAYSFIRKNVFLFLQEMQFHRSTARAFMYQACQTVSPNFRSGLQTQAIDLVNLQSKIDSVDDF